MTPHVPTILRSHRPAPARRVLVAAASALALAAILTPALQGRALAQQDNPAAASGPAAPKPAETRTGEQSAVRPPSGTFVNERRQDQWLASGLRNKNVYDRSDEKIGSINDLVIDRDGRVEAVVIGVGGFLGIGEKNVGVPFRDIKISVRDNNEWLVLDRSKDDLKSAPAFSPEPDASASRGDPSVGRPAEASGERPPQPAASQPRPAEAKAAEPAPAPDASAPPR